MNGRTVVILSDESQWPLTISCFLKLVSGPALPKLMAGIVIHVCISVKQAGLSSGDGG